MEELGQKDCSLWQVGHKKTAIFGGLKVSRRERRSISMGRRFERELHEIKTYTQRAGRFGEHLIVKKR